MIRNNLKTLGLALVAVFAFSAMAASSASAVDTFTGPAGSIPITATGTNNKLEITGAGAKFECTTAHFAGTTTSGSKEITVTPTYSGTMNVTPHTTHCSGTGPPLHVHMNGCAYILTGNTTGEDPPVVGKDATVWIECPIVGGVQKEITTTNTGLGVTIHIPPQTPTTGGVRYTNNVPVAGQVTIHTTLTGITYTCTPAFTCTLGGLGHHGNNSDYTGTIVASSTAGNISFSES
jgi:hypothetical protein